MKAVIKMDGSPKSKGLLGIVRGVWGKIKVACGLGVKVKVGPVTTCTFVFEEEEDEGESVVKCEVGQPTYVVHWAGGIDTYVNGTGTYLVWRN